MAHWRNSFIRAKFFSIDARAAVPIIPFLLYPRGWTFLLLAIWMGVFYWCSYRQISFESAYRMARAFLAGRNRPTRPPHKCGKRVDWNRRPGL